MNTCILRTHRSVAALLALLSLMGLLFAGCNDNTILPPAPFSEEESEESEPTTYVDLPIPYPSWFFQAESEDPPLAQQERIEQIKKGMTYAEVSEILGFRGDINEEYCVYDWALEDGDLLQITFDFPPELRYSQPDDMLVSSMRIVPAEEGAPVRYSIYIQPESTVEDVRRCLSELYGFGDSSIAKKVFEELDISNTDLWFKDQLPEITDEPSYRRFEGYFLEGYYFYDLFEPTQEAYKKTVTTLLLDMLSYFDRVVGEEILLTHRQYMEKYYPDYTPLSSCTEILTLASLIEGDGKGLTGSYTTLSAEYHGILNDAKTGGFLCSPSALTYGVRLEQGHIHVDVEAYKDYETAYNTYQNKGLPPTPICTPGLQAINAAIKPKYQEQG